MEDEIVGIFDVFTTYCACDILTHIQHFSCPKSIIINCHGCFLVVLMFALEKDGIKNSHYIKTNFANGDMQAQIYVHITSFVNYRRV